MKNICAFATTIFFAAIVLLAGCATPEFHEREPIVDANLNGLWLIRKAEFAGRDLPVPPGFEMQITGSRYRVASTTNFALPADRGRIVLFGDELAGQAARMDVVGEDGPNKGKRFPSIYRFNGREMELCFDYAEKERPGEFVSRDGTLMLHVIFSRK